jgi:hypothetical protein
MTRTERIAKLQRDLTELRSRLQRIEGETFAGARQIGEISDEITQLGTQNETDGRDV